MPQTTENPTCTFYLWNNIKWSSLFGVGELGLNIIHTTAGNAILQAGGGVVQTGLTAGNAAAMAAIGGAVVSIPTALAVGVGAATVCSYGMIKDEEEQQQPHRKTFYIAHTIQSGVSVLAPSIVASIMGAPLPVIGAVAISSVIGAALISGTTAVGTVLYSKYEDEIKDNIREIKTAIINCAPAPCPGMFRPPGYTAIN